MVREKIDLNDTTMDVILKMAEGNPGGASVLADLLKTGDLFLILSLDDMNIRGSQIWVAYKDHCNEDINALIECIKSRDEQMVDTVNANAPGHFAVTRGASFKRP